MGDFFLDFRQSQSHNPAAEAFLRFFPDVEVDRIVNERFRLSITRTGSAELWSPYEAPDGTIVALAGRIAVDERSWQRAEGASGEGGLACKLIYQVYSSEGLDGIAKISGAYAIHLYEARSQRYRLILDAAGCYPCFGPAAEYDQVYSSHADVLANATGASRSWDEASMASFLAFGQVTEPYTYYKDIVSLQAGTCYTIALTDDPTIKLDTEKLVERSFKIDSGESEDQLAEQLADAVAASVQMCTQSRHGKTFIALSGGLDSRLLVSLCGNNADIEAFCIRGGTRNSEFRTAEMIASVSATPFVALVRQDDHYGDTAELGVKISGGMGSILSNHFLGFRSELSELGCENLVTGCYFDYLFKSLALDTRETPLLRHEVLSGYAMSSYLKFERPIERYQDTVIDRYHEFIPKELTERTDEISRLSLGALRTFPLWREGDNIQRLVAQRVFNWYAPSIFNEILSVYWRTPIQYRLNKSLFKKVLINSVPEVMRRIPDNNTGLPIDATQLLLSIYRYRVALRRFVERRFGKLDTRGSWVNWRYYLRQSNRIRELWIRPGADSRALIEALTGRAFSDDIEEYLSTSHEYFGRLLTLKIWADQREP